MPNRPGVGSPKGSGRSLCDPSGRFAVSDLLARSAYVAPASSDEDVPIRTSEQDIVVSLPAHLIPTRAAGESVAPGSSIELVVVEPSDENVHACTAKLMQKRFEKGMNQNELD